MGPSEAWQILRTVTHGTSKIYVVQNLIIHLLSDQLA